MGHKIFLALPLCTSLKTTVEYNRTLPGEFPGPLFHPDLTCLPDQTARKPETLESIKKGDTVIIVAPGPTAEWKSCEQRFKEQKVG